MTKRAILYARVSTHNQIDNTSLDFQIEQCKKYADDHSYEVVRVIREQQSGAQANRAGLNTAKELGRNGLADCIIVYKMDRFMRGDDAKTDPGIDAAITERELNRAGLDVSFLDLPPKDSEAYAWIKAIKRIVASVERESIRSRFENGKRAALRKGKPAHGGRCPLGYKRNEAGYFDIVESEATAIRLIYDLYIGGMNVPSIVDYLRDNNVPGYRNAKGTWGDWIVYDILKREAYNGRYAIVKTQSVKDESRANGRKPVALPKDEWVYVNVLPIVSQEVWDKAQARRQSKIKNRKTTNCYYLLSGRVSCECGYAMTGYSTKATRKDGSVKRTRYYACKGKTNRYALNPCDARAIRADMLEEIVYSWVERIISDSEFIRSLYNRTQKSRQHNEIPLREQLDAIRIEKLQAEARLKRLARLTIDASDAELSVYTPEIEGLRGKVTYLTTMLANIEDELAQLEADDNLFQDFLHYIANAQTAIMSLHDDREFREKAIRAIDLHVTVSLDRQTVDVSCVVGDDCLTLSENVRITNASRTRCMDRKPLQPAPLHAPAPGQSFLE